MHYYTRSLPDSGARAIGQRNRLQGGRPAAPAFPLRPVLVSALSLRVSALPVHVRTLSSTARKVAVSKKLGITGISLAVPESTQPEHPTESTRPSAD